MIKAISFDLDGVYFLNGKSNFLFNLVNLGVAESEAKRIFFLPNDTTKKYIQGGISDIAYWTWAAHEWKVNKSPQELIDLLISGYELNQEAADYVRKCKKVGYKTLICTNNFPARIYGLDKRFKFLNDFDVVVTSFDTKVCKPDKRIFEILIERTGLEASEIVIADDNLTKLEGAKELGINTLLYTDFKTFVSDLEKLGVVV